MWVHLVEGLPEFKSGLTFPPEARTCFLGDELDGHPGVEISGEDLLLLAVLQDVPDLENGPGLEDRGTWPSYSGNFCLPP